MGRSNAKKASAPPERETNKPKEMFGGAVVNAETLRRDHMGGICKKTLAAMIVDGLPVIHLPGTQRYWFKPDECLNWILQHRKKLNQRRASKRAGA